MKTPLPLVVVLLLACGATPLFSDPGDRPPEVINGVNPQCPEKMDQAGDGMAILHFAVSTTGAPEDISLAECSRPEMESPAIDALLKSEFSPGMQGGVPVRMYMNRAMTFESNYNDPMGSGDSTASRALQLRPWKLPDRAPAGAAPVPVRPGAPGLPDPARRLSP